MLEIGVGRGRASPWFVGSWDYVGVEVNRMLLAQARRVIEAPIALATGSHLPFKPGAFEAEVGAGSERYRGLYYPPCLR